MAGIEGDIWKMKVDRARNPKREPGPIHWQRYIGTPAYSGIPTFMGVPICLTQEDLKAGKMDVAILGAGRISRPATRRRLRPPLHPSR